MTITAVTLGPHMVVGVRRWTIKEDKCSIKIETEAWEQRNGTFNDIAMQAGGKAAMGGIWEQYLSNIASAALGGCDAPQIQEYWSSIPPGQPVFARTSGVGRCWAHGSTWVLRRKPCQIVEDRGDRCLATSIHACRTIDRGMASAGLRGRRRIWPAWLPASFCMATVIADR